MLFYRFSRDPEEAEAHWVYAPTLQAIRPIAKQHRLDYITAVVEEIEISTDKRSMTLLLNGAWPSADVRRAWTPTQRGALVPMSNDEFNVYIETNYI